MRLLSDPSVLDYASDARRLTERMPKYNQCFDAIADLRAVNDDLATITNWGRQHASSGGMKRLASIPSSLLSVLLQNEPDFLFDKSKFYAWLDKHPEYAVYRRKRGR
jgi:hypothetical protein